MIYVVAGILLMIALGGCLMFFVMNKAGSGSPAAREPGDPTPVGDSPQHTEQDADEGGPPQEPEAPTGGRFKRDTIGGEAEAETTIDVGEAPTPAPER